MTAASDSGASLAVRQARRAAAAARRVSPWPAIFIMSLALPFIIQAGPIRLSPYRIVLLLIILPALFMWIAGKAGKIRSFDIYMLLFVVWSDVSIFATAGFDQGVETAGIWTIETLGAYLLGRTMIRDQASFTLAVKCFMLIVMIMLPLAAAEAVLKHPIALELLGKIYTVFEASEKEFRLGMRRAQGTFEHPILFGVFCSAAFGLAYYGYGVRQSRMGRGLRTFAAIATTFFSLSTGAYVSLAMQGAIIGWDIVTRKLRNRWGILGGLFASAYILIDAISNRTPAEVFISYMTFNTGNSYNRVLIWKYGTAQIANTPWIGIGTTGDWARAEWMSSSMDNFWLVLAVRHGLPAFLLFTAAFLAITWRLGRYPIADSKANAVRKGLLTSIIGMAVAICTVHLWNASYVFFIFLLASGVWMFDPPQAPQPRRARPGDPDFESSAGTPSVTQPGNGRRKRTSPA